MTNLVPFTVVTLCLAKPLHLSHCIPVVSKAIVSVNKAPPGWLNGERVGLMTW